MNVALQVKPSASALVGAMVAPQPITVNITAWIVKTPRHAGVTRTAMRSAMGTYKVVSTYPLAKDGWEQACQELVLLDGTVSAGAFSEPYKCSKNRLSQPSSVVTRAEKRHLGVVPTVVALVLTGLAAIATAVP